MERRSPECAYPVGTGATENAASGRAARPGGRAGVAPSAPLIRVAALTAIAAFVCAWLVYAYGFGHGGGRPLAWRDVTGQLGPAEFRRPAGRVFGSARELRRYVIAAMPGRAPSLPRIDFRRREAVLLAAGPRSSTGYTVDVETVREERGRIVVQVRERTPSLGDPVAARVTYPYRLITLPRLDKPVDISWDGRP